MNLKTPSNRSSTTTGRPTTPWKACGPATSRSTSPSCRGCTSSIDGRRRCRCRRSLRPRRARARSHRGGRAHSRRRADAGGRGRAAQAFGGHHQVAQGAQREHGLSRGVLHRRAVPHRAVPWCAATCRACPLACTSTARRTTRSVVCAPATIEARSWPRRRATPGWHPRPCPLSTRVYSGGTRGSTRAARTGTPIGTAAPSLRIRCRWRRRGAADTGGHGFRGRRREPRPRRGRRAGGCRGDRARGQRQHARRADAGAGAGEPRDAALLSQGD